MAHRWFVIVMWGACSSGGTGPAPAEPAAAPIQTVQKREVPEPPAPRIEAKDAIAFGTPVEVQGDAAWTFVARGGARVQASGDGVEFWGPRRVAGSWSGAERLASEGGAVTLPGSGVYLLVSRGGTGAERSVGLDCLSDDCRVECGPMDQCPVGSWCHRVVCVQAPCPSFCEAKELKPRR